MVPPRGRAGSATCDLKIVREACNEWTRRSTTVSAMQHIPRPTPPPNPSNASITTDAEPSRGGRARSTRPRCPLRLAVAVPSLLVGCPDSEPDADAPGEEDSTTDGAEATSGTITTGPLAETSGGSSDSGDPAEGSAGSTAGEACTVDDDCVDPTAPVCIAGMCLGCDHAEAPDEACAAIDPTRAVCGEDGTCVQCSAKESTACDDASPICNPDTNQCEGWVEHEQCPGTACDIETGACFSDDCVLYVIADEDATVTEALDTVGPGESCVIIVEALGELAELDHHEPATLEVSDGRRIALRGDYTTTPPRIYANEDVLVSVDSLATLYISDLRLGPAYTEGVVVQDGTLHLDRIQIESWGAAVRSTNAGARVRLRNTILDGDGEPDGALAVASGDVEATFVSIIGSQVALTCGATAAVSVRNSLVLAFWGDSPHVDCATAEISYSGLAQPHLARRRLRLPRDVERGPSPVLPRVHRRATLLRLYVRRVLGRVHRLHDPAVWRRRLRRGSGGRRHAGHIGLAVAGSRRRP